MSDEDVGGENLKTLLLVDEETFMIEDKSLHKSANWVCNVDDKEQQNMAAFK